jgi:hypothetical protein
MFPDMGDRETFEQTLKITNISATMFLTFGQGYSLAKYLNLFLDRVNRMYIYIFSVLFDHSLIEVGFYLTQICIELGC